MPATHLSEHSLHFFRTPFLPIAVLSRRDRTTIFHEETRRYTKNALRGSSCFRDKNRIS